MTTPWTNAHAEWLCWTRSSDEAGVRVHPLRRSTQFRTAAPSPRWTRRRDAQEVARARAVAPKAAFGLIRRQQYPPAPGPRLRATSLPRATPSPATPPRRPPSRPSGPVHRFLGRARHDVQRADICTAVPTKNVVQRYALSAGIARRSERASRIPGTQRHAATREPRRYRHLPHGLKHPR